MTEPNLEELLPPTSDALATLRRMAHESAYTLLKEMNKRATRDSWLQVATSESLTAGLIMATLVDIPWGGYLKYGCFGVYDTDAKRVFNKVSVDDVYTHRCAKEMAIGILKNSNATIAIAVTGNAMPLNDHVDMLGEVFIGIAGYDKDGNIIYITRSINACIENNVDEFKQTCKQWYKTIKEDKKYNPRTATALVSQEIRNYTTYKALDLCVEFINKNEPQAPKFVLDRKRENEKIDSERNHTEIPPNKYDISASEKCVDDDKCVDTNTSDRVSTNEYSPTGGKRTRRNKNRKTRRSKRFTYTQFTESN